MNCDIIKDLLPMVAAEECSAATRDAVEEHVQSCGSCKTSLDAMREPVAVTPIADTEKKAAKVEAMTFKKGFKKIRQRWLISILCLLLAVPFGLLGVNEIRGKGLAYSNLVAVYQADAFMKKIVAMDYEGAVEMLDAWPLYQVSLTSERLRDDVFDQYRQVQIGDEVFYSALPQDTDRSAVSLESGDPAEFWAQLMIDNAEQVDVQNPIPSDIMDEAIQIVFEKTGQDVIILSSNKEEADDGYTYIKDIAEDGRSYFFPVKMNRQETDSPVWTGVDYLSEKMLYYRLDTMFPELKGIDYHSHTYENLGFEEYQKLWKTQYVEQLQALDEQGIYVTSYSIGRMIGGWRFLDTIDMPDGSRKYSQSWYIDVVIQSSFSDTPGVVGSISLAITNSTLSSSNGYGISGENSMDIRQEQLLEALTGDIYVLKQG